MRPLTTRHTRSARLAVLVAVIALVLQLGSTARAGEVMTPDPGSSWQYQLSGDLDLDVEADVFDVDGFETKPL